MVNVATSIESLEIDFRSLEYHLQKPNTVSIVALSCGKVGDFGGHIPYLAPSRTMRLVLSL